jgi:hypothetical protein
MEPRAYSNAPIGTNFVLAGYGNSSGEVSLDPSVPITDIDAKIHNGTVGYSRFFSLLGRTASAGLLLPYFDANITGNVGEEAREVNREGIGHMRFRVAINLLGGPALTAEEFAKRMPDTTVGLSLSVIAPTGVYASKYLINIGTNRWAFKPEIGLAQPIGNWS